MKEQVSGARCQVQEQVSGGQVSAQTDNLKCNLTPET